jgi:DNA primase
MIPNDFIQALLARVDIVEVVERYLPLKRTGANYKACCPFHGEKTPSFTVSASKQFYHCFGCGASGSAITFLMEHSGLNFVEAVKELAGAVGMTVPEEQRERSRAVTESGQEDVDVPTIYAALKQAMHHYRSHLKQSDKAIAYLKERGLSGEIAAKFALGYAPDDWQSLQEVFPDYRQSVLLHAGLVIDGEGRRYDRFRDRVMFPILDSRGNVIAFGGRVIGQGEPKYLNSPETPVFEKGRELYGLAQARQAIRETGTVIAVEGYMDVVALAQHGVENAVATLGTATTGVHVQKLLRLTDRVVFCFDGDRAGRAAAWRALENSLPELLDKKQISFLFLPEEHDPDSFVRQFGKDAFLAKLRDALPLSDFLLRHLREIASGRGEEGRAQFVENAKPLILAIRAPVIGLMLRKRLAAEVGLTLVELDRQYGIRPSLRTNAAPVRTARRAPSLARRLLKCLLAEPSLALTPELKTPDEPTGEADAIPEIINLVCSAPNQKISAGALLQALSGTPHQKLVTEVHAETLSEWGEGFDLATEFQDVMGRLRERERERQIEVLLKKSEREEWSTEDKALYRQLTGTPG